MYTRESRVSRYFHVSSRAVRDEKTCEYIVSLPACVCGSSVTDVTYKACTLAIQKRLSPHTYQLKM